MAIPRNMAATLVLVLVCVLFTTQATANMMHSCMSENGVTRKDLVDFVQGQNDSREVKCFFKCVMMGAGKMNADGSYNMEAMKKVQPPALYAVASTKCGDFSTSDLCEKAYAHVSCLRDNAKEDFVKHMDM